jgi:hypothetical protein
MALLFAANRWTSGKGIYDYHAQANRLLDDMKSRRIIEGRTLRGPERHGPHSTQRDHKSRGHEPGAGCEIRRCIVEG